MKKLLLVAGISITIAILAVAAPLYAAECGGVETAIIQCDPKGGNVPVEDSAIWAILLMVLNILTGLVAVAAVGGLVYGAIMYASAQDNASQTKEAIGVIRNVIIGIVIYIGMFAILQYLIPGGVFK